MLADNAEQPKPKKDKRVGYHWWILTYNNPKDWKSTLSAFGATYATGQLEIGHQGTPHIQGVLYFKHSVFISQFKGTPCWIKGLPANQAAQSIKYVTKEDTRSEGPIEFGERPKLRKADCDYSEAVQLAKAGRWDEAEDELLVKYPKNLSFLSSHFSTASAAVGVRGIWYHGPSGSGKSREAYEKWPDAYRKAQNKWFDGYRQQDCIILDDLDHGGACLGHHLKIWADRYPCTGELKGSTVALNHKFFVVTSNYVPEDFWPTDHNMVDSIRRRFVFKEFRISGTSDYLSTVLPNFINNK